MPLATDFEGGEAYCRNIRLVSHTTEAKNSKIVADGENTAYLCNVERNKRPPQDKKRNNNNNKNNKKQYDYEKVSFILRSTRVHDVSNSIDIRP